MRNFKKFLALVLAMLMVSACAVSVSAAFTDQAAVDASGNATAIALLEKLGVVKGDENKNFNPDNTLRRDEAAVIIAKLVAGAAGQTMDWTAATTKFADVDAEWSFAYINYVADRKIMIGTDKGFEPTRELQIDEAIALALKAAAPDVVRAVEIKAAQAPTAYWATYYIDAAESEALNLTEGLGIIYDYEAACSRAMFAQIAANVFNNVAEIKKGFGYNEIEATITAVTDSKVTLTYEVVKDLTVEIKTLDVAAKLFNDALAENGVAVSAADLKGCKINFVWTVKNNVVTISKLEVLSNVAVVTHADKYFGLYMKDDKVVDGKLSILGTVYSVGVKDGSEADGLLGGSSTATFGTKLTIDGKEYAKDEAITIPEFYKAFVYDDDKDNDVDRIVVYEYEVGYIKCTDAAKGLYSIDGAAVVGNTDKVPVIWTTNAVPASDKIPVLVQKYYGLDDAEKNVVIDILDVAKVVEGKFGSYSASGKYVVIDNNKYAFINDTDVKAVDTDLVGMTASIYTLGGKYVEFLDSSVGTLSMIVDSADINADGKIVVSGYNTANYAAVTEIIDGYFDGSLYRAGAAQWDTAKDADNKDYNTTVSLAAIKDGKFNKDDIKVTLTEGLVINLAKTADAVYYVNKGNVITTSATANKLKVEGKYFYLNGSAAKVLADGFAVLVQDITVDKDSTTGDYKYTGKYSDIVYKPATSFAEMANVKYNFTENDKGQMTTLYIADGAETVKVDTVTKTLAEGQTIVYVYDAYKNLEVTYDASVYTYDVVDLLNKSVITITSDKALTTGKFYVVKDNKMVEDTTNGWISGAYSAYVHKDGIIETVKAAGVAKVTNNVDDKAVAFYQGYNGSTKLTDEAIYDMTNTIVYDASALFNSDKALAPVDTTTAEKLNAQIADFAAAGTTYVFADGSQLILVKNVPTPAPAPAPTAE